MVKSVPHETSFVELKMTKGVKIHRGSSVFLGNANFLGL